MYTAVFVMLILGGIGFPFPEELPLIIAGVGAANNIINLQLAFLVCYAGVMIADQTMYFFGYFFGQKLLSAGTRSPIFPSITEDKVNEVREGLRKRRLLYLFIGRHLFFLRSVTFVVAGSLRVPFFEFFLTDAIAALFSVTLFMWLGYLLGNELSPEVIQHIAHEANMYILIGVILGAAGYYVYVRPKLNARSSAQVETLSAERPENEHLH